MTLIILNVLAIIVWWYGLHIFKGRINYWLDLNTRIIQCDFCRGHGFGIITGILITLLILQAWSSISERFL